MTTAFMGNHYEVSGSTVSKYYYAGAQRIAMNVNGTVSYLLSDQLGSTSITANGTGGLIAEIRYKAWGEVRYTSGTAATKYTYTGQYSNMDDFGLMFYNARWYDPVIILCEEPLKNSPSPRGCGLRGTSPLARVAYPLPIGGSRTWLEYGAPLAVLSALNRAI